MRILFIFNSGLLGGLQRHVLCLMTSLRGVAETAVVINTVVDKCLVSMFLDKGHKVYLLNGRSGHDPRIINRFEKIIGEYKPDIIHAHGLPWMIAISLGVKKLFSGKKIPIIHSIHTPTRRPTFLQRLRNSVLDKVVDYWLPVSHRTWENFLKYHPGVKGEVFYNPLKVDKIQGGGGMIMEDLLSGSLGDLQTKKIGGAS